MEFIINAIKIKNTPVMCRDRRYYSSKLLNDKLSSCSELVDYTGVDNVQDFWNVFEHKLIIIIDEITS